MNYYKRINVMPPSNRHVVLEQDGQGFYVKQLAHDTVHRLSDLEAAVLKLCDGETPEAEAEQGLPEGYSLSEILASFAKKHLLTADFMPIRYPAVSQPIGEEILVYVSETGLAHLLKPEAAEVYAACDGRSVEDLSNQLGEDRVWSALEELSEKELVPRGHPTRRRFLQAAAALPVILSVVVPAPSAAASGCIQETAAECNVTSQSPPTTCTSCCNQGSGASNCTVLCSVNCTSCVCLQRIGCAGGNCTTGSCLGDVFSGVSRCFFGDGSDSICAFGAFNVCRRNCAAARSDAASSGATTNYRCCQGCT
jgi:hypothetical protein